MSVPKFHRLKIREIRKETADCVSISFEVPRELVHEYAFLPGQHLTLRKQIEGEDVRRSYSICAAPSEGDLRVAVKRVSNGVFSNYVNSQLKKGDELEVMTPSGRFYDDAPSEEKARLVAAFAAGSGITPVISILKYVLETEPESQFALFYVNRRPEDIIFLEEIEGLKNRYLNRLSVYHFLSRQESESPLFSGRLDESKCRTICKTLLDVREADAIYLCGPFQMVETLRKTLVEEGGDPEKIHVELFAAPGEAAPAKTAAREAVSQSSRVSIKLDGRSFELPLSADGETILDAALRTSANLPYACKGGVCCTCKALLLEGEVHMDRNYGLEPDEIAAGYILTCQAHPLTEVVKVDFDI